MRESGGPRGNVESLSLPYRGASDSQMGPATCSPDLADVAECIPDLAKMSLETIAPGCTNPQGEATSSVRLSKEPWVQATNQTSELPRDSHRMVDCDPNGSKLWNAINAARTSQNTFTGGSTWSRAGCCPTEATTSPPPGDQDLETIAGDDPLVDEDIQGDVSGKSNHRPKYSWDEKIVILYLHVVLNYSWKAVAEQFLSYQDGKGHKQRGPRRATKRTISGLQSEAYRLFSCKEWNLVKRRTHSSGENRDVTNKNRFWQRVKMMKKEDFLKELEEKFNSPRAHL